MLSLLEVSELEEFLANNVCNDFQLVKLRAVPQINTSKKINARVRSGFSGSVRYGGALNRTADCDKLICGVCGLMSFGPPGDAGRFDQELPADIFWTRPSF